MGGISMRETYSDRNGEVSPNVKKGLKHEQDITKKSQEENSLVKRMTSDLFKGGNRNV
jgi:hypothetical protein